jgi:hypothetical protein
MPPVQEGQTAPATPPFSPAPIEAGASTESGPGTSTGNALQKRVVLLLCEAGIIIALLVPWLFVESVRSGKSLVVLFFYSFPSEFLVGLVPHEPVLIYWGGFHPAWVVALVSVVGTVMAEGVNYFGSWWSWRGIRWRDTCWPCSYPELHGFSSSPPSGSSSKSRGFFS